MTTNTIPPQEVLVDDLTSKLTRQDRKEQNQGSFPPTGSKAGPPTPETEGVFPRSGDKSGPSPE